MSARTSNRITYQRRGWVQARHRYLERFYDVERFITTKLLAGDRVDLEPLPVGAWEPTPELGIGES